METVDGGATIVLNSCNRQVTAAFPQLDPPRQTALFCAANFDEPG